MRDARQQRVRALGQSCDRRFVHAHRDAIGSGAEQRGDLGRIIGERHERRGGGTGRPSSLRRGDDGVSPLALRPCGEPTRIERVERVAARAVQGRESYADPHLEVHVPGRRDVPGAAETPHVLHDLLGGHRFRPRGLHDRSRRARLDALCGSDDLKRLAGHKPDAHVDRRRAPFERLASLERATRGIEERRVGHAEHAIARRDGRGRLHLHPRTSRSGSRHGAALTHHARALGHPPVRGPELDRVLGVELTLERDGRLQAGSVCHPTDLHSPVVRSPMAHHAFVRDAG